MRCATTICGIQVKDKNENLLTRARTHEDKMEEKFKWQPLAPPPITSSNITPIQTLAFLHYR